MTLLEKLRLDRHQSPEQLAHDAGLTGKTIRDLEAGKVSKPQLATMGKLSTLLGVHASALLEPASFSGSLDRSAEPGEAA